MQIRRSTRCCPTKETQTEWSQGISFFYANWSGKSGENTDNQDTSVIKRMMGKKAAESLAFERPLWEQRKCLGCLCKRDDLHVHHLTAHERKKWMGWKKTKKKKSLWKMKCDSQSLRIENLDHEFPRRWETFSRFTPPLQSTTSALITQPESNLVSLVFAEA